LPTTRTLHRYTAAVPGEAFRSSFFDHPGPLAFAHRGGAHEAPENSWTAFEHAVELGYRYIETDVRATSDGVAVAFHDARLDRLTNRPGLLCSTAWAELARLQLSDGRPVPKLEELLDAWPTLRWNIDVKADEAVGPTVECIERSAAKGRVLVTAFSDRRAARLAAALPAVATGAGRRAVATMLLTARLGLPVKARADAYQVPCSFRRARIVSPRFVAWCHASGAQVHVWTVDDENEMARLLDLGVDGIMTDRPSVLKTVLGQRGQWA
jgi:glycerophosphoryl diester phosphodiesterase